MIMSLTNKTPKVTPAITKVQTATISTSSPNGLPSNKLKTKNDRDANVTVQKIVVSVVSGLFNDSSIEMYTREYYKRLLLVSNL